MRFVTQFTCHCVVLLGRDPSVGPPDRHLPLLVPRLPVLVGRCRQVRVVMNFYRVDAVLGREVDQVDSFGTSSGDGATQTRRVVCS